MCIDLFVTLDSEKDNLGIQSYGMKDSTMEEVFVKVMEEEHCENNGMYLNGLKITWEDQEGAVSGPSPLLNHRWPYVFLKILVWTPSRSNWTLGSIFSQGRSV